MSSVHEWVRGRPDGVFEYRGYWIPEKFIWATGAGPELFEANGVENRLSYCELMGLMPFHHVIDIGCGAGRDTIELEQYLSKDGSYIGLDINKEIIDWLSKNIRSKNFSFRHVDAHHDFFAPELDNKFTQISYPVGDASADKIIANSVFTHLLPDEAQHFLKEVKRILRVNGAAYITCNAISEADEYIKNPMHDFNHKIADGCFVLDDKAPTLFVAYTPSAIFKMLDEADLCMRVGFKMVRQDVMVVAKK